MRQVGTITAALLVLMLPSLASSAPAADGLGHEARAFAADHGVRSTMGAIGETGRSSTDPFFVEATLVSGPIVQGGRTVLVGGGGETRSAILLDRVFIGLLGGIIDARGVQSEAVATCAGSTGTASIRTLTILGQPIALPTAAPNTRYALPGGNVAILNEQIGIRALSGVMQSTAALRVRDAAGASLAVIGATEARLTGCAQESPGACPGFEPALDGVLRVGDAAKGGAPEMALGTAVANVAWLSGVPTYSSLTFAPQTTGANLTSRGNSWAAAPYTTSMPAVDAIVLTLTGDEGAALVEDLRLDGVVLASRLEPGAVESVTLRGYGIHRGFTLGIITTYTWMDAPADPDAIRLDVQLGHCP